MVYIDENGKEVEEATDLKQIVVKEQQKLKGMKKCVVKKKINHCHYKECVLGGKQLYEEMITFRSYDHKLRTVAQNKLALSSFDDKRWILNDGISTLAHGHWRTL